MNNDRILFKVLRCHVSASVVSDFLFFYWDLDMTITVLENDIYLSVFVPYSDMVESYFQENGLSYSLFDGKEWVDNG